MKGEGRPSAASDNEVPAVMGRMNLRTQHHAVLSQRCGVFTLFRFCFGRQLCQGLYCLRAYFCTCNCSMRNVRLSTDHCFSMFQHATHTIVVLDTARPWASEAYGLCRLCTYFCGHKLLRARSYGLIVLQIVASKSIVALETAWPWANDTYELCCLRAYFCARELIRARSCVVTHQKGIAMGFVLQIRVIWLRALSRGCRCWCLLWSCVLVL